MKKFLSKTVATLLIAATLLFCVSCKTIKDGSEIHRVKITVTLYDTDGNAQDTDVYAELYVNFAPITVAHIESLINAGYYNGLCISNVTSDYAQFGDAKLNDDGKTLNFIDQGETVKGEFSRNGWTGNKLTVGGGALVLKRADADEYDSGKATIAVTFGSSTFTSDKYCVFGKFVTDDGDENADDDSLAKKSSYERIQTLTELVSDDNGITVYYCDKDGDENSEYDWAGQYITYAKNGDSYKYYKGLSTANADMLSDDEQVDFEEKKSANALNFRTIPAKSAVIKSVTIEK